MTNNNSFISKILQEILKSKNWKQKVSKTIFKKKKAKGQWQIQNPIIKTTKKNTKQCQWLLRQLRFQYRNCCNQTRHGVSPAILEGKPGPTEGAQRMSLLGSRKLFASIVLLSWRLSAQPVDYGILCILSPSLQ